MALSGSTTVAATSQDDLLFTWSAIKNTDESTYTISWTLQLVAAASGALSVTDGDLYPWTVTIDGQEFSGNSNIYIGNNETKTLASGEVTIQHSEAGTRIFEYLFSQYFGITWSDSTVGEVTGSGTGELDALQESQEGSTDDGSSENAEPDFDIRSCMIGYALGLTQMSVNKSGIDINIACGSAEPTDTNKLWIKSETLSNVVISFDSALSAEPTVETRQDELPWALGNIGIAVIDGIIWYYGGASPAVVSYDPNAGAATNHGEIFPYNIRSAATAVIGKKIYIFGGITDNTIYRDHIWCYDTETNTYEAKTAVLPVTLQGAMAVAVGTKIYLYGGQTYDSSANTWTGHGYVFIYDTETDTLTKSSTVMPTGVFDSAFGKYGNQVFFVGGKGTNKIQIHNLDDDTFTQLDTTFPVSFGRQVSFAVVGSKICVIGGYSDVGNVQTFDMATQEVGALNVQLPLSSLYYADATAIGTDIYIFGGCSSSDMSQTWYDEVYKISTKPLLDAGVTKVEIEPGDQWDVLSGGIHMPCNARAVWYGNDDGIAEQVPAALYIDGAWAEI